MSNLLLSASKTTNVGADVTFTVFMTLITVALLLTAVWLVARFICAKKGRNVTKLLVVTVAVGVALRVLVAFFVGGYREDMSAFTAMVDHFMKNGFGGYYAAYGNEVYPLTFYVFAVFGGLGRVFGIPEGSAYLSLMLKLPLIIADVFTAILLYRIGKKFLNSEVGLILAALFCVCPAFFLPSAAWGSTLTLMIPFVLAAFYRLVERKHFEALLAYSLALLVTKEAIYLYPIMLVYYGYHFVNSIIVNVKEKKPVLAAIKDGGECSLAYRLPLYFIGLFLLKYVIALSLVASAYGANPFVFVYRILLAPLADFTRFSLNGPSIFNIFGKNGAALGSSFPNAVFAVCFAVLIAGIAAVVYFSKKNRAIMPLLAAYVFYTLATYFLDSSPLALLPALVLMLAAFPLIKDRRILQIFCVGTIVTVLLPLIVMTDAGYLNMLNSSAVTVGASALTGGGLVVLIICSVLSVAAHLYLTLIAFDITMSNNRRLLDGRNDIGYFEGIKKLFK